MTAPNRAALLSKAHKVLKKHYQPVSPPSDRTVLEHLLYACCVENAGFEAADEAFDDTIRRIKPLPPETRRCEVMKRKDNIASVREKKGGVIEVEGAHAEAGAVANERTEPCQAGINAFVVPLHMDVAVVDVGVPKKRAAADANVGSQNAVQHD